MGQNRVDDRTELKRWTIAGQKGNYCHAVGKCCLNWPKFWPVWGGSAGEVLRGGAPQPALFKTLFKTLEGGLRPA